MRRPTASKTVPRPSELELRDEASRAAAARIGAVVRRLTHAAGEAKVWRVEELRGGATNLNFRVGTGDDEYVLRISDFDADRIGGTRASGLEVQTAAAAGGIGAPVAAYAAPEGHCLTRFIPGDALDPALLRERRLLTAVARLLRRMHDLPPVAASWSAFSDIARYRDLARSEDLELPPYADNLVAVVAEVRAAIESDPRAVGFCHNDLQIQNIIDDSDRLWLIDWEWAGIGNRYFDLGGFVVNAELDPDETERFAGAYFGADEVNLVAELARIQITQLVSAVREALWAVVAASALGNDWNYGEWARDYFERGWRIVEDADFGRLLADAAGGAQG